MKTIKSLFFGILICLWAISCNKDNGNSNSIEITGTIQKQGITTYQYGTHTISEYALTSSAVNLDSYINQNVTVIGYKIEGYPVDSGPDYVEVERIK